MTYQVKKTWVSLFSGFAFLGTYGFYILSQWPQAQAWPLETWAQTMLLFIGISVGVLILIQILFHIVHAVSIAVAQREKSDQDIEKAVKASLVEDEMDRLIDLKSSKIAFGVSSAGLFAALGLWAWGLAPALGLNILFVGFALGALLEGFAQLMFYKKGLPHA